MQAPPTPPPSETTLPAAEDVVLVVEDVGGFVPIEFALGRGPRYVLTGDGRLIFQGPMIEIFPQPLWPNYQVRQLTDDELDLVMDAILVTGIDQITDEVDDNSANIIADASTTVITYYDDQGPHRFEVYALDIGEGQSEQVQRLAGLVRVLDGVATAEGEVTELEPERVRVIAQEAEPTGDEFEQVVDFPIDEDPATWDDFADSGASSAPPSRARTPRRWSPVSGKPTRRPCSRRGTPPGGSTPAPCSPARSRARSRLSPGDRFADRAFSGRLGARRTSP